MLVQSGSGNRKCDKSGGLIIRNTRTRIALATLKLHVTTGLRNSGDPDQFASFYGAVKGPNNNFAWGDSVTYTLTGLEGFSNWKLKNLAVAVYQYRTAGTSGKRVYNDIYTAHRDKNPEHVVKEGGTVYRLLWKKFNEDLSTFDRNKGWIVKIPIHGGLVAFQMVTAMKDTVTIAGRNVFPMNASMGQIDAPGSKPEPYSTESLALEGGLDFKAGEGERPFENFKDYRSVPDPSQGFIRGSSGKVATKYARSFVLNKGDKLTITCKNPSYTQIETYNKGGSTPLWLDFYDMCRVMPNEVVGKNLQYKIRKINPYNCEPVQDIETIKEQRHLTHTWNDVGDFEVQIIFMEREDLATYARVKVVDYGVKDQIKDLSTNTQRGTVKFRVPMQSDMRILEELRKAGLISVPDALLSRDHVIDFTKIEIGYVTDVLSEYKYVLGPRATAYGDRFGEENDYNNQYRWIGEFTTLGGERSAPADLKDEILDLTIRASGVYSSLTSYYPKAWKNIFLRHCSSNYFPKEDLDEDKIVKEQNSQAFTTVMDKVFTDLSGQKTLYGPVRWLPWISFGPTSGIKIATFDKTATNLYEFFNGTGSDNGAWSGNPYINIVNTSEAAFQDTPMDDHTLDLMALYNDLLNKRIIIKHKDYLTLTSVWNVNPRLAKNDKDKSVLIFMAGIPKPPAVTVQKKEIIRQIFSNSYQVFKTAYNEKTGLFLDKYHFKPEDFKNDNITSPGANGFGLIALCIADQYKLDDDAKSMALKTLTSLTNHITTTAPIEDTDVFTWPVNNKGFPLHYVNIETGVSTFTTGNYSTIDAAIMACGALFAKEYFTSQSKYTHDDEVLEISALAEKLYRSIDWPSVVVQPTSGRDGSIFREQEQNGENKTSAGNANPFNEYNIIGYLAEYFNATEQLVAQNSAYWSTYKVVEYPPPGSWIWSYMKLPTVSFMEKYWPWHDSSLGQVRETTQTEYLLTDDHEHTTNSEKTLVSSFIPQYVYFLCHGYTKNSKFTDYVSAAAAADYGAWREYSTKSKYAWGCGAGPVKSSLSGNLYRAETAGRAIVEGIPASPYIMAGFLPVCKSMSELNLKDDRYNEKIATNVGFERSKEEVVNDLVDMYVDSRTVKEEDATFIYNLPNSASTEILWRYGEKDNYRAPEITVVDFATMFLGLAPHMLEMPDFFPRYNNFFKESASGASQRTAPRGSASVKGKDIPKEEPAGEPDSFSVYPVPVHGKFMVKFYNKDLEKSPGTMGEFEIVDLVSGRIVRKNQYSYQTLSNMTVYTSNDLAFGVYAVRVTIGGKIYRTRIVVSLEDK